MSTGRTDLKRLVVVVVVVVSQFLSFSVYGMSNFSIVPSVSLHAVKGSEWIMTKKYREAAHSQFISQGTPWPVD